MATDWTGSKKFWMETLRAVVLGAVGALVATFILGKYSDYDKALRESRIKAIDESMASSSTRTSTLPAQPVFAGERPKSPRNLSLQLSTTITLPGCC
jgi:hypothetical protein